MKYSLCKNENLRLDDKRFTKSQIDGTFLCNVKDTPYYIYGYKIPINITTRPFVDDELFLPSVHFTNEEMVKLIEKYLNSGKLVYIQGGPIIKEQSFEEVNELLTSVSDGNGLSDSEKEEIVKCCEAFIKQKEHFLHSIHIKETVNGQEVRFVIYRLGIIDQVYNILSSEEEKEVMLSICGDILSCLYNIKNVEIVELKLKEKEKVPHPLYASYDVMKSILEQLEDTEETRVLKKYILKDLLSYKEKMVYQDEAREFLRRL